MLAQTDRQRLRICGRHADQSHRNVGAFTVLRLIFIRLPVCFS